MEGQKNTLKFSNDRMASCTVYNPPNSEDLKLVILGDSILNNML